MIIEVTKKVEVEISSGDITKFRKDNRNCTNDGPLSVDDNIAQILADTKATSLILRRDRSVETITSIDNITDLKITR